MTDEDKTLLEMAAKAAGLQYIKPAEGYSGSLGLEVGSDNPMRCYSWNPLEDDGDALRLAVKLHLSVEIWAGSSLHKQGVTIVEHDDVAVEFPHESDPYTATRRAIVRAAAEIGKTQQ